MGVVEGRPEHLAARHVLEGRGDAAAHLHRAGVDRLGRAEARQRGAEGAHQEDRLDHVAARLLDGERRQLAVVERAFGHHAVDAERKLLGDLGERQFRHVAVAAPLMRQQAMGILDGAFAALDGDIHGSASPHDAAWCAAARRWHRQATSTRSMPRGNSARLTASRSNRSAAGARRAAPPCRRCRGRCSSTAAPSRQAFDLQDQRRRTIRIFVACRARSGRAPAASAASRDQRKAARSTSPR